MTARIPAGATVLFIGDSITDSGRDRSRDDDLGTGYPALITDRFDAGPCRSTPRFINRGISGNRVGDLRSRWDIDCLQLKPDLISILIGINDTVRYCSGDGTSTVQSFKGDYKFILQRARDANPLVEFVLIEPFLLPVREDHHALRRELDRRIAVVDELADHVNATVLAADQLLVHAAGSMPAQSLCPDGIHPSAAGHSIIADAWLRCTNHDGSSRPHLARHSCRP